MVYKLRYNFLVECNELFYSRAVSGRTALTPGLLVIGGSSGANRRRSSVLFFVAK